METTELRDARVVVLAGGMPTFGPCAVCASGWGDDVRVRDGGVIEASSSTSREFFRGLVMGLVGFGLPETHSVVQQLISQRDARTDKLRHMQAFAGAVKLPWVAQMMRYILRPKDWLSYALRDIVTRSLMVIRKGSRSPVPVSIVQGPYVSIHVRHGMKQLEAPAVPSERFVDTLRMKYPLIKSIFISTETERVIEEISERSRDDVDVYYLDYDRVEHLSLNGAGDPSVDYPFEFVFAMANLYVAVEAYGFIGTLSSNWCALIQYMERTRGDGGSDYHSLDMGSAWSTCFQ